MRAESAYRCVFDTYDKLQGNKLQQWLLLKLNYFEKCGSDTNCMLEEKGKYSRWVVDKVPFLRDIKHCCRDVANCRENKLRASKLVEAVASILIELSKMEKNSKAENARDSEKPCVINWKSL